MNNVVYAKSFDAQEIHSSIVTITPELAEQWLQFNTRNRNVRRGTVTQYANDMRNGNWRLNHQGIAFSNDGVLTDGQHRLMAVVESGVSVRMMVTTGLPRDAIKGIDQGGIRKPHDSIRIAGGVDWLERNTVAVVRMMMSNMGGYGKYSVDDIERYAREREDSIRKAMSLAPSKKKNLTCAPVLACYAAALMNGEQFDQISRFAEVIYSGISVSDSESAAIRLRDYLLTHVEATRGGGHRLSLAKRTQRAIYQFCRGIPVRRLQEPKELIYPTA